MKVKGKCLKAPPKGIREIVVSEKSAIQMASFPVKAESAREFFGYPDIDEASITDEDGGASNRRAERR